MTKWCSQDRPDRRHEQVEEGCRSTALYSSSPRNRRTSSSVCKAGALVSPSSCLDGEPHGWVPVDTHSTPVPSMTGEAVGGLCSRTSPIDHRKVRNPYRNRAFQEDRARDCQNIEELRRICCMESDRVTQLLAQIHYLQDKVEKFNDPEPASSSQVSHLQSQPMSIPTLRGMVSHGSCLPPDTRNSLGTSRNFFESLYA